MEPVTEIVSAVADGADAAAQNNASDVLKNGYARLKAFLARKFADRPAVMKAVAHVEQKPRSESRRGVLQEELDAACVGEDAELQQQAQLFLDLLEKSGFSSGVTYQATNTGSGAIAQGQGAVAAGAGGIAVSGNVGGGIIVGNNNQVIGRTGD